MLVTLVVNWNVRDQLRACLHSLQRHPPTRHAHQIVVVDNASVDDSAEMVRREFPAVHLLVNAHNRGFSGGKAKHLSGRVDQGHAGPQVGRAGAVREPPLLRCRSE
jgi:GT2 family glycosyltransferase